MITISQKYRLVAAFALLAPAIAIGADTPTAPTTPASTSEGIKKESARLDQAIALLGASVSQLATMLTEEKALTSAANVEYPNYETYFKNLGLEISLSNQALSDLRSMAQSDARAAMYGDALLSLKSIDLQILNVPPVDATHPGTKTSASQVATMTTFSTTLGNAETRLTKAKSDLTGEDDQKSLADYGISIDVGYGELRRELRATPVAIIRYNLVNTKTDHEFPLDLLDKGDPVACRAIRSIISNTSVWVGYGTSKVVNKNANDSTSQPSYTNPLLAGVSYGLGHFDEYTNAVNIDLGWTFYDGVKTHNRSLYFGVSVNLVLFKKIADIVSNMD